jgi:hypothetical protein
VSVRAWALATTWLAGVGACASSPEPAKPAAPAVHIEEPPLTRTPTDPAAKVAVEAQPEDARKGLARNPRVAGGEACERFFPPQAEADLASVMLIVSVDELGKPTSVELTLESPPYQGFGASARECAMQLEYFPALDAAGHTVAGRMGLRIRYARRRLKPSWAWVDVGLGDPP